MDQITITLNRGSYDFMRKTLNEHKAFLYRIKMPELARSELVKDVSKVTSVLDEGIKHKP